MAEKFSIVKQLDVSVLNSKIASFTCVENYEPYIFASKETLDMLREQFKPRQVLSIGCDSIICKYQGYKMFEDSTLNFGEIELR